MDPAPVYTRLYWASAARTVAFYGFLMLLCLVLPALVFVGIGVFFLRFYRVKVSAFFDRPAPLLGMFGQEKPEVLPVGVVRLEPAPPFCDFASVESRPESRNSNSHTP